MAESGSYWVCNVIGEYLGLSGMGRAKTIQAGPGLAGTKQAEASRAEPSPAEPSKASLVQARAPGPAKPD